MWDSHRVEDEQIKDHHYKKKHFQFIHVGVQMEYEVDWMFTAVYVNHIEEGRKIFGGS